MIFAQLDGALSGWSAFGLAGIILGWLFLKHLPAKDEQLASLLKAHREERDQDRASRHDMSTVYLAEIKVQRKDFADALSKATESFKTEASAERAACEKHFETLANAMSRGNEATIQAVKTMHEQTQIHAERNKQWSDLLKQEMAKREKDTHA